MKCPICEKVFGSSLEPKTCCRCNYWIQMYDKDKHRKRKNPYSVAIIDNHHYVIESENDPSPFRGFGGDRFEIEFNDGTKIITTNLWSQGEIPENMKEIFPNNAIFPEGWHWVKSSCGTSYMRK